MKYLLTACLFAFVGCQTNACFAQTADFLTKAQRVAKFLCQKWTGTHMEEQGKGMDVPPDQLYLTFKSNGTYVNVLPGGETLSGTWKYDSKKECLIMSWNRTVTETKVLKISSGEMVIKTDSMKGGMITTLKPDQ